MKFSLEVNLGKSKISITESADGQEELFEKASFFMNLPTKCGNCGESDLALSHKNITDYDFYSVVCKECGHELKYGQKKEGGLFPKEWDEPYSSDEDSPKKKKKSSRRSSRDEDEDDDEYENSPAPKKSKKAKKVEPEDEDEDEDEEEVSSAKKKRSDILSKFNKKKK